MRLRLARATSSRARSGHVRLLVIAFAIFSFASPYFLSGINFSFILTTPSRSALSR